MTDEGNRPGRRVVLRGSAALAPVAAIAATAAHAAPGAVPLPPSAPPAPTPASASYTPTFFDADEWAFINAACARLIPNDANGPGAVELGVPQYIDRQMGTPWSDGGGRYMAPPFVEAKPEFGYQASLTPKQQYRAGIKAINAACQKEFSKNFAQLESAQQDDVLKRIEGGKFTSPDLPLRTFFSSFLLKNTLEGYFGDPQYGGNKDMAAWKMIGYPGVRADYFEWVSLPQKYPYGPVDMHGARS